MNRIDRLFGILLLLQTRRKVRAEDIATKYEITQRTVYRDMSALMQLGVPIISQAGDGYSIIDGYFLPPLVFTADEAKALFLGVKMLASSGNLQPEADNILAKVQAAIPNRVYREIAPFIATIEFFSEKRHFDLQNPLVLKIQEGIQTQRVIKIRYLGWDETVETERDVEPMSLIYNEGTWYFNAYCRMRQDMRSFRVDRVKSLHLLAETYIPDHSFPSIQSPTILIAIWFPAKMLQRVRERQHYSYQSEKTVADGCVFHYHVHQLSEIQAWVLGWGADIDVIEPETLRQAIRNEAEKWLKRY